MYSSVARQINLILYSDYQSHVQTIPLRKYNGHFWGVTVLNTLENYLYGYRLHPDQQHAGKIQAVERPIADPYSTHIVWKHNYLQESLTKIVHESEEFDWQGTDHVSVNDVRDLIIYETHLKDQTGHPSSESKSPGTYTGFVDSQARGGLNHIKQLGVNAIELLPLQKFAVFEPPYMQASPDGSINTWNYYGRNYWGYMTSFFKSPESFFSSEAPTQKNALNDTSELAHKELKTLVRECHKEDIAVIVDVVYNHASNYDLNPLRYLDPITYFRWENGGMTSGSGCGNDIKTEHPVTQELILDSLCYWVEEFKVDGFRFDLAALIDWETIDKIQDELQKIHPNVILIAEPWYMGGYAPSEFADKNWSVWNDRFRNGIKGVDPGSQTGYIFGSTGHLSDKKSIHNYLCGSLSYQMNGLFPSSRYSVNYVESHDGYTLGDFIRITLNPDLKNTPVEDHDKLQTLNDEDLPYHKIVAMLLMFAPGTPMIHAGQEFARSKIIASNAVSDPDKGKIDHDSYNKDNETNYLNFHFADKNKVLVDFYRQLIELRKQFAAFRSLDASHIKLWDNQAETHITVTFESHESISKEEFIFALNVGDENQELNLPDNDRYERVFDMDGRHEDNPVSTSKINIPPLTGILLKRLHD